VLIFYSHVQYHSFGVIRSYQKSNGEASRCRRESDDGIRCTCRTKLFTLSPVTLNRTECFQELMTCLSSQDFACRTPDSMNCFEENPRTLKICFISVDPTVSYARSMIPVMSCRTLLSNRNESCTLHDVPSLRRMRRGPTLASTSVVHYWAVPITDRRKSILLYAALAYNL
jgi:hypothetical protein